MTTQQRWARLAGLMYLLTIGIWAFTFWARSSLYVVDDAAETFDKIAANETLFRISIAGDLVMAAGVVVLVVALWAVLKPVNETVATLALFLRFVDPLLCVITLSSFPMLFLVSGAEYLQEIEPGQLQAFAMLTNWLYGAGFMVSAVFLGLGSTAFSYLLFTSRYVPRALAGFGVAASSLAALSALLTISLPSFETIAVVGLLPLLLYELALGGWLLFKGVRIAAERAQFSSRELL